MVRSLFRNMPIFLGVLAFGIGVVAGKGLRAEDFRVYTVIHDARTAADGQPGEVLARTVTLFHAGKVYDYVESAGDAEVIIFEPSQRRFRILSPSRSVVATAAFDEIRHKLNIAREETSREARILSTSNGPRAAAAEMLAFQLSPRFETDFDESKLQLSLTSNPITYRVEAMRPEEEEIVTAYLDYCDWVCRLNYVMTVGTILPEPRLAMNRVLRENGLLPRTIALTAQTQPATDLRAEHTFHWKLNENERNWIHQWETRLNSKSVRKATLQQYQKEMLTRGQ